MKEIIFSFNPIFIIVGIMLTFMAAYTAIDLFLHMKSMKSNRNFLFLGSSFSMSISFWMMSFFGILAIDLNSTADQLIVVCLVSMFCSFIITSFAFIFFRNLKQFSNLIIGCVLLSVAVMVTNIINLFAVDTNPQFNIVILFITFVMITSFFIFSFWFLLYSKIFSNTLLSIKAVSTIIISIAIGQGFLMIMKSSMNFNNSHTLFTDFSIDGSWMVYSILTLSVIIFAALLCASILMNKKIEKENLYAKDIMTALDSSSIVAIMNPKGTITYVNEKLVEISKYSKQELIGANYHTLNAGNHDDDCFKDLWRTITGGEVWKGEVKNITKDGNDYWVSTTITPFLDSNGSPYQYVAILTDITKRKHIERELKTSLKEVQDYKYALDQASIVAITDEKGIITKVNENFCEISQYSREELIGSSHRILNSKYHSKSYFNDLWKTIGGGRVWKGEMRNKAKDGSYYWVETTIVPFLNERNKPYQYLAIRNNITDKKKQEEVLHRQDKLSALGQLAAGVAHEIRNPLTSMRGYTEFLLLDEEKEDRREHLEIILEEINRVNAIVEEFMMLAKPKADLLAVKNINTIVQNTLSLFSYEAKKKKVTVLFETNDDKLLVLCDENRLRQVFLNLIKNSIEAMPNGGNLTIKVMKNQEKVTIELSDTGIGISQEQLNKIGEPFYTTKETGTGLGLMISFKIIESHYGKIDIDSEPGKGTTFKIILPITNSQE